MIASVVREHWGPKSYEEGLTWYRRRMKRNLQNTNLLGDRVLTLSLENLVISRRDESLETLLGFLNIPEEPKIQDYFHNQVLAEKVRQGRWRDEVEDIQKFNESYFNIVSELKDIDPNVPLAS